MPRLSSNRNEKPMSEVISMSTNLLNDKEYLKYRISVDTEYMVKLMKEVEWEAKTLQNKRKLIEELQQNIDQMKKEYENIIVKSVT